MKKFDKFEELNENAIISKDNALLSAKYRLNIYELRIINLIMSRIEPDSDNCMFTFKISEIAEFCQFEKEKAYSKIRETCVKLRSRAILISKPAPENGYLITGWISSAKYQSGIVQFEVDHKLLPYLKVARNFTVVHLQDVNKFTNIYAQRLYEWLLEVSYKANTRKLSILEIKRRLGIEKLYPEYDNFRRRVIEPAIADIHKHTNMIINFIPERSGRKITDIIFKFEIGHNDRCYNGKCPKCGGSGFIFIDENMAIKCSFCKK